MVVEEERFEGFDGRVDLLVRRCVGRGFDEFLVGERGVSETTDTIGTGHVVRPF
jgi:hypothetical protein